ncbi:ribosomal protein S12 methylthiotransferase accessory factor [Aquimarina amphilecti]|uniref:Ribosomal protein S12 methylthiotransferase accessory factor n=1 Tax=Aquimarina amphilecti TaxID=1038014 RepID=A0A1H7S6L3_AQUAM|nr:TOMM precursor leader peptide-binding protein [Aquimarina amphilecti]SEL68281.1 ribosomal protein S12 methylthiotransferase accessory factor [Aquimarina amphilecti]
MIDNPRLKSNIYISKIDQKLLYVISDQDIIPISDPLEIDVLEEINKGKLSTQELAHYFLDRSDFIATFKIISSLEWKGFIREDDSPYSVQKTAYWEELGFDVKKLKKILDQKSIQIYKVGNVDDAFFKNICIETGIRITDNDSTLSVVLTDDYSNESLISLNQNFIKEQKKWLLIKPIGNEILIGPFFIPDATACWKCLHHRLTINQPFKQFCKSIGFVQEDQIKADHPISVSIASNMAVLEVVKWLYSEEKHTLKKNIVSFNTSTMNSTYHAVTKRPQCKACGDEDIFKKKSEPINIDAKTTVSNKLGGYRTVSPEETFEKYKIHISNISGIVPKVSPYHKKEGIPIFNFASGRNRALQSTSLFWLNHHLRSGNGGKGKNSIQARTGALCEAIERYSLMYHGDEYSFIASYEDLEDAILPNECMNFSQTQFEKREEINKNTSKFYAFIPQPFDIEEKMEWTSFYSLTYQKYKHLPSCFSYSQYPAKDEQKLYSYPDSNGCAAGNTVKEAILQGFLELVERDAAAIWWYNRIRMPEVDLSTSQNPYLETIEEYYKSIERKIYVLDITSDLNIPTFVAISSLINDSSKSNIIYAFGSHIDVHIAIERAVIELNQLLPIVQSENYLTKDQVFIDWLDMATFKTDEYLVPKKIEKKNLQTDYPILCESNIESALDFCVETTKINDLEVLFLDLTKGDIGLPVVKVIAPGLRHFWRRTGQGRLYDVPVKMGWLDKKLLENELNPKSIFI